MEKFILKKHNFLFIRVLWTNIFGKSSNLILRKKENSKFLIHNFIIFASRISAHSYKVNDSHETEITLHVCLIHYEVLFHYVNIICRNQ